MTDPRLLDTNEYLSTLAGTWPSILVRPDDVIDCWDGNGKNVLFWLGYKLDRVSNINKRALELAHMRMTGDIS